MLNISWNALNYVLKVKNGMVAWVEDGSECIGLYPPDCGADRELQLTATGQHHEGGCAAYHYSG